MTQGGFSGFPAVVAPADNFAVFCDDAADGNLPQRGGLLGKRNGFCHEPDVLRGEFWGHDCTSLGRNTRNLLKK